jgi:hypothetical protein
MCSCLGVLYGNLYKQNSILFQKSKVYNFNTRNISSSLNVNIENFKTEDNQAACINMRFLTQSHNISQSL